MLHGFQRRGLREIRMQFNRFTIGLILTVSQKLSNTWGKIGDADRFQGTGLIGLFQRTPGAEIIAHRLM